MSEFFLITVAIVGALVVFVLGPLFVVRANRREERQWREYFEARRSHDAQCTPEVQERLKDEISKKLN